MSTVRVRPGTLQAKSFIHKGFAFSLPRRDKEFVTTLLLHFKVFSPVDNPLSKNRPHFHKQMAVKKFFDAKVAIISHTTKQSVPNHSQSTIAVNAVMYSVVPCIIPFVLPNSNLFL